MAHYGDSKQEDMYQTVQMWIADYGLKFVLRTLLEILAGLVENAED